MSATRTVFNRFVRGFKTSAIRQSGHDEPEGFPGANLPFKIDNRYRLTGLFVVFFGSAVAIPFLILRHQLLK